MAKPSTFDLLRWSDIPDSSPVRTPVRVSATNDSKAFAAACDESSRDAPTPSAPPSNRKPAGGPCTFAFGEQISNDEAEALLKRKPLSETKKREICGNKLFSDDPHGGIPCTPERITGAKLVQPPSQITFGETPSFSPKKITTPSEAAKQRDLSGSSETVDDVLWRRTSSNLKNKEREGNNIFGDKVPEIPPSPTRTHNTSNEHGLLAEIGAAGRPSTPERRKSSYLKTAELSGNNIFNDGDTASLDKQLSNAKLSEINGSNIFADEKPVVRDCLGGVRKPPGGESTIALV